MSNKIEKHIQIIFSDVDGTLVHYPELTKENKDLLYLPASSTGLRGIISYKTLDLCCKIRQEKKKLVLVSGMRTSTLFSRLPYLPKADAYCSDGGGRIFYSVDIHDENDSNNIVPKNGDLPFRLEEDLEWRSMMEDVNAAGPHGYISQMKVEERQGVLWDYARSLMKKGWILDTKGYATCFRINKKQQTSIMLEQHNFDDILSKIPDTLSSSVNLGCIDVYPKASGKKHCCQYLVQKFLNENHSISNSNNRWICLCDDDNDLEMALFCHHAYIPSVTSESMQNTISKHMDHFTVSCDADLDREGVFATEYALQLILEEIKT